MTATALQSIAQDELRKALAARHASALAFTLNTQTHFRQLLSLTNTVPSLSGFGVATRLAS